MTKTIILVAIVIGAVLLMVLSRIKKVESSVTQTLPGTITKPTNQVKNDKLVMVKTVKLDLLKQAIEQFCKSYNQESYVALPRLIVLNDLYIVTFPYDIDFERFCYFINYLKYPINIDLKIYKPNIVAWCSTNSQDAWMTDDIANKNVMIYIPEWDKDYDNVYLTTQDNIGFKMGFAIGHAHKKLDQPVLQYRKPEYEPNEIHGSNIIDFQ